MFNNTKRVQQARAGDGEKGCSLSQLDRGESIARPGWWGISHGFKHFMGLSLGQTVFENLLKFATASMEVYALCDCVCVHCLSQGMLFISQRS